MTQLHMVDQDKRFVSRLRALRHLPPGTPLPVLNNPEERQLLQDLLQLPENTDYFRWLQEQAPDRLSRIMLTILIGHIFTLVQYMDNIPADIAEPHYYQQLLGNIPTLLQDEAIKQQWQTIQQDPKDVQELLLLFQQMQTSYRNSRHTNPEITPRKDFDQLLLDLLRLPFEIEPLIWLQKEQLTFMPSFVLSHLLQHFEVTKGILLEQPTLRRIAIHHHFQPAPGLSIKIQQLLVKPDGFLVEAQLHFIRPKLILAGQPQPGIFLWYGFDQVVDNNGYHYLTWDEIFRSGGGSFHRDEEELTMAFYPALASSVTELTFSSQPVIIKTLTSISEGRQRKFLADITGKDLFLRVSLAAK